MNKGKEEFISPLYEYREGMPWNPVEKIIMERRSIRLFKKEPVPDGVIRRVLEAGRFAPSAGNCQPWKFIVIKDPEVIKAMEEDTIKLTKFFMWFIDYDRSFLRRIFLGPVVRLLTRIVPNMLHPIPFNLLQRIAADAVPVYHNPPVMVLILVDRRGVGTPKLDAGICGQNMVLAAHSLGLGSCWVGMITLLMKRRKWRKYFGVKYPFSLDDCLIFGWPRGSYDGEVDREVQIVDWFDENSGGKPRSENQGV